MSETNGTSNISVRKDRIQECPCIDYMDCPEIKELLNQMGKLSRASAEYKEKKKHVMSKICDRKTKTVKCSVMIPVDACIFTNFASYTTLSSPQAITFSPSGELYIGESDSRRINRVSVVGTDGRISLFAGKDSKCNCQETRM